jgi:hypothetical protein
VLLCIGQSVTAIILLLRVGFCPITDIVHSFFKVTAEGRWRQWPAPALLNTVVTVLVTVAGDGPLLARLPAGGPVVPSATGLASGLVFAITLALGPTVTGCSRGRRPSLLSVVGSRLLLFLSVMDHLLADRITGRLGIGKFRVGFFYLLHPVGGVSSGALLI